MHNLSALKIPCAVWAWSSFPAGKYMIGKSPSAAQPLSESSLFCLPGQNAYTRSPVPVHSAVSVHPAKHKDPHHQSSNEIIKTRQIIKDIDRDSRDVIVRTLQQPTCVNACINENGVEIEVVLELLAEVIGEATMIVTVYPKEEIHEEYDDDFENEINENFIFEKQEDSALE